MYCVELFCVHLQAEDDAIRAGRYRPDTKRSEQRDRGEAEQGGHNRGNEHECLQLGLPRLLQTRQLTENLRGPNELHIRDHPQLFT